VGENQENAARPLPYVIFGAIALGFQFLAGHIEISYYVLLVMAFYAAIRLWQLARVSKSSAGRAAFWLMVMVILGLALGAVQLVPLYELVSSSFRQDSASYQQVVGWAFKSRRLIAFLIPDFFGNPSQHSYFDVFSRQAVTVTRDYYGNAINTIYWGIKNYVEAGSYVGVLPLLLAVVALFGRRSRYLWIFASLALLSLLFAFGTPLYALLFYILPGYGQLHTPFRWVFPYTLSLAILAGLGADRLAKEGNKSPRLIGWLALSLGGIGLLLTALIFSRPDTFIPLADRLLAFSQKAQGTFASGGILLSYEWPNLAHLALFLTGGGLTIILAYLTLSRRACPACPGTWQAREDASASEGEEPHLLVS